MVLVALHNNRLSPYGMDKNNDCLLTSWIPEGRSHAANQFLRNGSALGGKKEAVEIRDADLVTSPPSMFVVNWCPFQLLEKPAL